MPIDKITVEQDGKRQDVFIAMTKDEGNDKSYREYLKDSTVEQTREQLRAAPEKPKGKTSKEQVVGAIKEYNDFRRRKRQSVNRKYY